MPLPQNVPSSLLGRARVRDEAAWHRLAARLTPLATAWARRDGVPAADAPDVAQEVLLDVARALPRFRPDGPFLAWVRVIARRRAADWHRRHEPPADGGTDALHRLAELPAPTEASGPDPAADRVRRALATIRGEFEPRTWQAFERVTADGRSAAEAGAELGMTAGAVHVAKSRVLKRLRAELGG